MKKIVYVGFAFKHHKGTHAGYHHIKDWLKYDYIIDCQSFFDNCTKDGSRLSIMDRVIRRVIARLLGVRAIPWFVLKIIWLGITQSDIVFHFIYGENTYFSWIKRYIRKSNKIVCTFHQPLEFFQNDKRQKCMLKTADHIILVGKMEVDDFKVLTGRDNVVYIPHGISSDFYDIDNSIQKENTVLTVGNWLRDYRFADKVYKELLEANPALQIHVVSSPANKKMLTEHPRMKFMSNISDEELKSEYMKCSVLFLPLTRYTANNSLLEASSTGCNIVISSDFPDNSYIPEVFLTTVPMDVPSAVSAIRQVSSLDYNYNLSHFIKTNYGWDIIADKTREVLLRI